MSKRNLFVSAHEIFSGISKRVLRNQVKVGPLSKIEAEIRAQGKPHKQAVKICLEACEQRPKQQGKVFFHYCRTMVLGDCREYFSIQVVGLRRDQCQMVSLQAHSVLAAFHPPVARPIA